MLTISVKNFGPIAEGTVDLKPLTIFVGPSNTGKSYMATAVYTLLKAFEQVPVNSYGFYNRRLSSLAWFQPQDLREMRFKREVAVPVLESLRRWVDGVNLSAMANNDALICDMPKEVQELAQSSADSAATDYLVSLRNGIQDNFGKVSELIRISPQLESLSLMLNRDAPALSMNFEATYGASELELVRANVDATGAFVQGSDPVFLYYLSSLKEEIAGRRLRQLENYYNLTAALSEAGTAEFFRNLPMATHYFPAARSGLMEGYKSVSSAIVRRRVPVVNLKGITANFLGDLLILDWRTTNRQYEALNEAVKFVERNVAGGVIDLDDSPGLPYPEIVYETTVGKFPVNHTSSMVSELAPIILFLKYLAGKGDTLILEEPESHLHPAAQRQLARGIVRLVNAGVKVMITTHSDIIISQVNNLLALRQASPELIAEGGFEPEDFLREDQVGAYLFRYNHELAGSEVVPLEIDPDTGIDEDEFATVFEAIYDESISLQRDRN